MLGLLGLNPGLARRARTEVGDVWVIPGNGFICLSLDGGGGSANATDAEAATGVVTWGSYRSLDQCIVHGLVPDGVHEVTLMAINGDIQAVPVHENVYGAVLDGFLTSVRFTGPSGNVVLGPWR